MPRGREYAVADSAFLVRAVGLPGAIMMGLGSIIGTGVFVSLGLAAKLSGPSMILALFLAGILAACNGLSTAQLSAAYPVSGGTYEYGRKYLEPRLGFIAGWLFVCAKSASAATAALGFGAYLIRILGLNTIQPWQIGLIAVIFVTIISLFGVKRSNVANIAIVSATLIALIGYVSSVGNKIQVENLTPFFGNFRLSEFLESIALLFVAYTGYGRIATLGEEIKSPETNIPKAIVYTLALSFFVYMAVAIVSIGAVGSEEYSRFTLEGGAPLESIASHVGNHKIARVLAIGAMTAMLGVLLNLILGLSRVIFALGRNRDLPKLFTKVNTNYHVPYVGILASSLIVCVLIMTRDIKTTWSFSAFTVLIYYALTNAAALRLPTENRLYPRIASWFGLVGCFALILWIDIKTILAGIGILVLGLMWRGLFLRTQEKAGASR